VTPSSYAQNVMTKYNSIREHIFFKDLDWGLLETKQLPPPYLPLVESVEVGEANKLSDFFAPGMTLNECLVASNKGDWISSELSDPRVFKEESQRLRAEANRVKYMVTDDMNQYFVEWNHCSLIAIEEEIKAQMSTNKAGDTRPSAPGGCCVPFIS
jgi:hypothetical protein